MFFPVQMPGNNGGRKNNNNGGTAFPQGFMMMGGNNNGGGFTPRNNNNNNNNNRRNNNNNNNNNNFNGGQGNRLQALESSVGEISGFMKQQMDAIKEAEEQRKVEARQNEERDYQEKQLSALRDGMTSLVTSATRESEKRTQDTIKALAERISKAPRPAPSSSSQSQVSSMINLGESEGSDEEDDPNERQAMMYVLAESSGDDSNQNGKSGKKKNGVKKLPAKRGAAPLYKPLSPGTVSAFAKTKLVKKAVTSIAKTLKLSDSLDFSNVDFNKYTVRKLAATLDDTDFGGKAHWGNVYKTHSQSPADKSWSRRETIVRVMAVLCKVR